MSGIHSDSVPPHDNPILKGYENYLTSTPFVTRVLLNGLVISYFVSWIVDLQYAMAFIPHFVVQYYEIYRVLTSVLVNQDFLSLAFAFFSFLRTGKLLEEAEGSATMAWLSIVVFTCFTNLLFLAAKICHAYMFNDPSVLLHGSSGIWMVLFGMMALECTHATQYQPHATRKLLLCNIPTLYYPVAILLLFSFLSGRFQLSYAISCVLGYGIGYGKLEFLKLRQSYGKVLEESSVFQNSRIRQLGWISASSARGSASWITTEAEDEAPSKVRSCYACAV